MTISSIRKICHILDAISYPCRLFSSNFSDPGCDVDRDAGKLERIPPERLPLPSNLIAVVVTDGLDESPVFAAILDPVPPLDDAARTSCSRCCRLLFLLQSSWQS